MNPNLLFLLVLIFFRQSDTSSTGTSKPQGSPHSDRSRSDSTPDGESPKEFGHDGLANQTVVPNPLIFCKLHTNENNGRHSGSHSSFTSTEGYKATTRSLECFQTKTKRIAAVN